MKFTKVTRGWYATEDGRYAVVVDGWNQRFRSADNDFEVQGREWAAVFSANGEMRESHNAGENMDWFDTRREAVHFCENHARRTRVTA